MAEIARTPSEPDAGLPTRSATSRRSGRRTLDADPSPKEPKPHRGCDVCEALYKQWLMSMNRCGPAYDPSHAVDLGIEIGRHPHGRRAFT